MSLQTLLALGLDTLSGTQINILIYNKKGT